MRVRYREYLWASVALAAAISGCAATPLNSAKQAAAPTSESRVVESSADNFDETTAIAPSESPALTSAQGDKALVQVAYDSAESIAPTATPSLPEELGALERVATTGVTLEILEQAALTNHPAIAQAEAQIRALCGKQVQVGLPPNPTAGYVGSEIGNEGAAGQQGAYFGQEFVRGSKLQFNRAVVSAEIQRAREQLAAVQQQVRTDIRMAFYATLLAQRRSDLAANLVQVASAATAASQSLVEAKEIPLAGLLQAEVQLQTATVLQRTAENRLEQSWREISALVATEDFAVQRLEGNVARLPQRLDWQQQLDRLKAESPEIAMAMAEVERTRRALTRACVEPIPNVTAQLSVQHDYATQDTVSGVQIGVPLPIWNRNQGGIREARAEVTAAARNVDRVEQSLVSRLADSYRDYADSLVTTDAYAAEILPRAKRTLELTKQGYELGEVGYLDFLTAQRTYSEAHLAYLDALSTLWMSYVRIDGVLLQGSLDGTLP